MRGRQRQRHGEHGKQRADSLLQRCRHGAVRVERGIGNSGWNGSLTATGGLANLGGAALTGATFTGPVSAPQLGPIYVADAYPGSDCGVKINAAITASGGVGTIQVGAGCGYTISTMVNPTGQVVAIQFVSAGTWTLSAPIIDGAYGGSISGFSPSEGNPMVWFHAAANYSATCPADIAGTTYSALICMQRASSLYNLGIYGEKEKQPSSVITSYTTASGVVTLQSANTFTAGQAVYFNIASGPTFLNPELPRYTVLSSGLSASQFEVAYPGATGSGSATGMAAASIQDVVLQNGGQITIKDATIMDASQDGIHVTTTLYPTITASQVMSLNAIVFMYSSPNGLPQLYKVTTAGTGTSTYPGFPATGCTAILNSTCTWGGVTFTNIGATYDNASGNGFIGPNVIINLNGRDGMFTERNVDWTIGPTVQFELNDRDGFHCEDCSAHRFSLDDFGANGRYGFYAASVNSGCSTSIGAVGFFIQGTQFGANGYLPGSWSSVGGDIHIDGSAATAMGFCATPATSQMAGSSTIVGNQFIESAATANNSTSVELFDAGGNNLVGNNWGIAYGGGRYNYLVNSTFSLLTGSARTPNQISKTSVLPASGGPVYTEGTPYLLTTGVDVADAVISQGTETSWKNTTQYGSHVVVGQSAIVATSGSLLALTPADNLSTTKEIYSTPASGSGLVWWIGDDGSATFNGVSSPSFTTTGVATYPLNALTPLIQGSNGTPVGGDICNYGCCRWKRNGAFVWLY